MGDIWLDSRTWYYKPAVGNLWQERFIGKRFDSQLGKSSHPTQNHALRLYLRVFLNPINKRTSAQDFNKKTFPIKDWTPGGWEKFTKEFEKQSNLWNYKFWLVPPRHFSIADFDLGRKFVRPNIVCHLHTELADTPGKAHRTVDVFNIDVDEVKRRNDLDDDNPYLGKFRSDDRHLDSTDVNTGSRTYEDEDGNEYTVKHHYTIAHEIGHALGLDHIKKKKILRISRFYAAATTPGFAMASTITTRSASPKTSWESAISSRRSMRHPGKEGSRRIQTLSPATGKSAWFNYSRNR